MQLAELRSWALAHPQMPQAVAVLALIEAHERLAEQVRTQLADAMEQRDKARAEAVVMREGRDKLAAFKAYVHKRLDDQGVPVDPDSPHKAEGCRIGGRLDWLFADAAATDAEALKLRAAIKAAGFAVMETSGAWSIHDVSERGKAEEAKSLEVAMENVHLSVEAKRLREALTWAVGFIRCAHPKAAEQYPDMRNAESLVAAAPLITGEFQMVVARAEVAEHERDRLREAIWPGLPKWEPTAEQPQQDFYLALVEAMRSASATCEQYAEVVQGGKRLPAPELSQDPAFAAFVLGALEKDRDKLRAGFERIGVGDFRQGWLDEADRLMAFDRHGASVNIPDPLVWVARTRELVECMVDAHHAAGRKTQYEADHEARAA